jgi:hypothetical protein
MDLIDRYVVEVARHLPAKSAEDVAAELRSLLSDAFEARAARTGRPKDEALAVEVLREFGEPEEVAARYRGPKQLIGPDWYPIFKSVALGVLLIPLAIKVIEVKLRMVATGGPVRWADVWSYAQYACVSFAITVLVFVILERTVRDGGFATDGDWDPRDLPGLPEKEIGRRVPRWESAHSVWLSIFWLTTLNMFPGIVGIFWGFEDYRWFLSASELGIPLPVTLLNVLLGGLVLLKLVLWRQGRWSAATRWAQFTVGLLAIVVIGVTLSTASAPTIDAEWFRARGWIGDYSGPFAAAGRVSRILRGLLWTGLFWQIFNSGRRLWRLLDHHRLTGSPAHPITL